METRFLQTFVVVVETSSLAEAARKLNITPSAVVQRIRALESEIGCKLIHRSGHSMRPTAVGAAILAEATRIVKAVRDLNAIAGGDLEVGGLTVGVFNTAMTGMLPDVLSVLKRNRPRIESGPRFFTLDPAGKLLYAANELTDTVVAFRIDEAAGTLTPTGQSVRTGSPTCIVFSGQG
jgi:DNA-binding transcriptional LysR family regulator